MIVAVPVLILGIVLLRQWRVSLAAADVALHDTGAWRPTTVRVMPDRARAIAVLALAEARRLVMHPAMFIGFAMSMLILGTRPMGEGYGRYAEVTGGSSTGLYLPLIVFTAANLCASRTRRARTAELFDATAATSFDRTLAQCLAALGPAAVVLVLVLGSLTYYSVLGPNLPAIPPLAQLLSLPLTVLGAGTLGVMVARWLPYRGAALVVLVGLVFGSAFVSSEYRMLITLVEYAHETDAGWVLSRKPDVAHAAYLLGLDVMAVIGALLVHAGRRRALLALGAVVTAATLWAAVLQV